MSKSKELVKQGPVAVAVQHEEPLGFEDWDMDDMVIPRLRVVQLSSKAMAGGEAKLGQFQDSLSGEVIGDAIEVVPLKISNGAVYFELGQGLKCRSLDGVMNLQGDLCQQCPYGIYWRNWDNEKGKPPKCSGVKDVLFVTRESLSKPFPYAMVAGFYRSSYGVGKRFASAVRMTGTHIFGYSWHFFNEKVSNDKGTFAKMAYKRGEPLSEQELEAAKRWYFLIKGKKAEDIKVHDDGILDSEEA